MTAPNPVRLAKMNGLGNEIVVADLRDRKTALTPREVEAIATTPRLGFDQLMVLHQPKSAGTDAYVRIYNNDGSEVSACGNGTRCVGWLAARDTGRDRFKLETGAGVLDVRVAGSDRITVDMGRPKFAWADIPLAEPFHDTRGIELQIGPIDNPILHSPAVVNVGNPHAVFFVDDIGAYDLARFGPLLENHPIFPQRANISLAKVTARDAITVKTWERGVGLTRACGTAACAVAVCAARKKLADRKVTITLPGGKLDIEWTDADRILMTGPAVLEFETTFDLGAAAKVAG